MRYIDPLQIEPTLYKRYDILCLFAKDWEISGTATYYGNYWLNDDNDKLQVKVIGYKDI